MKTWFLNILLDLTMKTWFLNMLFLNILFANTLFMILESMFIRETVFLVFFFVSSLSNLVINITFVLDKLKEVFIFFLCSVTI